MTRFAVVRTGGKQYLVKENDEIVVDRINQKEKEKIALETLMIFSDSNEEIEIGSPTLEKKTIAEIVFHDKGEKIRIVRFKAKVRYRRVKGFRPQLTTLKILKIES
ncbi:MAG: 50S ribosomal protein L21 [Patescibacteria group bacterium]|nr:50S ribosomal protein L21 [Patescibacteria group bacterium]